ncbi:MAG: hypothetical protein PVG65_05585 [Candidatus Thorarchaeota archaeon]|jgi:hypothetical protein
MDKHIEINREISNTIKECNKLYSVTRDKDIKAATEIMKAKAIVLRAYVDLYKMVLYEAVKVK